MMLVFAITVSVAGAFFDAAHRSYVRNELSVENQGAALNRAIVEHASKILGIAERVLASIVESLHEIDSAHESIAISSLFQTWMLVPGLGSAVILDSEGELRTATPNRNSLNGQDALAELYRTAKIATPARTHVSRPFLTDGNDKWSIYIGRTYADASDAFAGIVALEIDLSIFRDFYLSVDVGPNSTIGLWRDDTILLTRRPFVGAPIGRRIGAPLIDPFQSGAEFGSFVTNSAIDSTNRRVIWRRVPDLPIIVTVAMSTADYRSSIKSTISQQAIAIGFSGLLVAILASIMWIQLGRLDRAIEREKEVASRLIEDQARLEKANSELLQANRKVAEANSAKSEFLANASHEFRTPLNAILGFSDIMRTELLGPISPRYRSYSHDIHAAAEHLIGVVGDILDLQKIESRAIEVGKETVDIGAAIENCTRLLSVLAQAKGINLDKQLPSNSLSIISDERRVTQIIINLLSNSIKYSNQGGLITISASRTFDGCILTVEDKGIGMTPEELALADKPFRQVAFVRGRSQDSVGLGLPIVHGLVDAMGGRMVIESVKGQGTKVTIFFVNREELYPHASNKAS